MRDPLTTWPDQDADLDTWLRPLSGRCDSPRSHAYEPKGTTYERPENSARERLRRGPNRDQMRRTRRHIPLKEAERNQIIALHKTGMRRAEIASEIGRSERSVDRVLTQAGLTKARW